MVTLPKSTNFFKQLYTNFQEAEEEGKLPDSSFEVSFNLLPTELLVAEHRELQSEGSPRAVGWGWGVVLPGVPFQNDFGSDREPAGLDFLSPSGSGTQFHSGSRDMEGCT